MKSKNLVKKIVIFWVCMIGLFHIPFSAHAEGPVPYPTPLPPPGGYNTVDTLKFDENYIEIKELLGSSVPGLEGQCYQGRREILNKLNELREAHPDLFVDIEYGPVRLDGAHMGVVLYKKNSGEDYISAIERTGVVVDYTNWASDWTGEYQENYWQSWGGGQGKIDDYHKENINGGSSGDLVIDLDNYYWNTDNNPKYPTAVDINIPVPIPVPVPSLPPEAEGSVEVTSSSSHDPNEKVGSAGFGLERYVTGEDALNYVIYFENIGSAPAQTVTVVETLDTQNLDMTSFYLGGISFGSQTVDVPARAKTFDTLIDLGPDKNILLKIEVDLNTDTGEITWFFKSIDPETWTLPEFDGFLPPNLSPPQGEGSVTYTITPKPGLTSNTQIGLDKRATIIFDENPPIETNHWVNTIDNLSPDSQVTTLAPTYSESNFEVSWYGDDDSSGIKYYSIYVSENGAPYSEWIPVTNLMSSIFFGEAGASYSFDSIAFDNLENSEEIPTSPDAVTTISDLDGDGQADGEDNCPDTPNPDQVDSDEDGIGNICDQCPDDDDPECATIPGDLDKDGDIDRDDVNIIKVYRNQPASVFPEADIDEDGTITVLDARKLMRTCTLPRCASPEPE